MAQDMFNQGFGALAPPNPRRLPFDFNDNDSSVSLPPPPPPARGHQRSRTTTDLPPLFTRAQSSSPTRSSAFSFLRPQSTRSLSPERLRSVGTAEDPGLTESPSKRKSGGLASWFEGSSDPVNISLVPSPRKEKLDPLYEASATEEGFSMSPDSEDNNLTRRLQKKPSLPGPAVSTMSKFNNIFRRSTITQTAPEDPDDLAQLDIDEALFPHGHPGEFSPAAFKNLQLNAEGTIRRFQQAYKEQRQSLRSATSTKNVQADELEAAQTRNEHLKLQLQEMAERAAEQQNLIADLRAQLAAQLSLDSQQSVRIVPQNIDSKPRPKYRRNRSSDVSTSGESEAGSEVSSVVSIFSEALSAAPSQATSIASPVLKSASLARDDCPRCHGLRPADAWDVVGMMKMESAALKHRIAELESAQDDALDFLSGLKLSS
ncbi:uncharacterized protein PV07_06768 [Cladophialophora immunda]|uniref:Uncharacterized protein n=1 Tax=Cladophialophora immunda TaxID=569365 RepID=A0A0D1ZGI7_9EURO|nr:uncharacterized protein PV07_06768 [Cladophialophora immunda]KIW26986.1 hypothetical protein PV07_06768 [Cladophialophora immunda]